MFDEDKLFNFLSSLQSWEQVVLRRHGVQDLSSAIAVGDRLLDYKSIIVDQLDKRLVKGNEENASCQDGHWQDSGTK